MKTRILAILAGLALAAIPTSTTAIVVGPLPPPPPTDPRALLVIESLQRAADGNRSTAWVFWHLTIASGDAAPVCSANFAMYQYFAGRADAFEQAARFVMAQLAPQA